MRLIDADALISDLEYDVAMDQDMLDYEELTEIKREIVQFDKDCKQNAIDLLKRAPTIEPEYKWISDTNKQPDDIRRVQIQLNNSWIITGYYDDGYWYSVPDCGDALNGDVIQTQVVAWRELPEPYRKEDK